MQHENSFDLIEGLGLPYFAHLLRRLSDEFVRGFDTWNEAAGLVSPTRTRSTLMALDLHGELNVTDLAALIRQSHPLVITWIRQLKDLGLIQTKTDQSDRRKTLLRLTTAGVEEVLRVRATDEAARNAYLALFKDSDVAPDLIDQLWRVEAACRRMPFSERLLGALSAPR